MTAAPSSKARSDAGRPSFRSLRIRRVGAAETVTLDRPEAMNGLNLEMIDELLRYFHALLFDETVRVVVLTGAGRSFCAGLDIKEFDRDAGDDVEKIFLFQRRIAEIILAMRRCPQPIVALINGAAAGGGFALALACDIRIAAPHARMNAAFIKVGLSACDVGVSYLLPRLVGSSIAAELMLTGRFIDAERALRIGLVSEVVAPQDLEAAAKRLVGELLESAPLGLRLTKEGISAALAAPTLEMALAFENRAQVLCAANRDLREGLNALLEKRDANYAKARGGSDVAH
jgi:enoyl-CoA hydratase/carnithine racemase